MDIFEAVNKRHSVRAYLDKPIEGEVKDKLLAVIDECNKESGLNIQLVLNEPKAFDCLLAHYGKFSGVNSYIAMIGKKEDDLDEKVGYYGEKIVLKAQTLGLNTCWVAATFKKIKNAYTVEKGEKLSLVIAIGYGATEGKERKSKQIKDVCSYKEEKEWFIVGVKCALAAPTAMNQQKFRFNLLDGDVVEAKGGTGFYSAIDLGIAKYHFEIGANGHKFTWKE